jgi:hypothetical protein
MSAGKMLCDCGCGVEDHFARLQTIEITGAIDESLRQTFVAKRFLVRKQCYEPFIEELKAMKLLQDYVYRFTRAQKTHWWTRAWRMRRIVRMQFVVHVRNRGIDFAKKASMRSGLLFVCSPRISGLLWRYWSWADKHELRWRFNVANTKLRCLPSPFSANSPSSDTKSSTSATASTG